MGDDAKLELVMYWSKGSSADAIEVKYDCWYELFVEVGFYFRIMG